MIVDLEETKKKQLELNNTLLYLQFELKLSTVARFLTCNGDLTAQLQGHGAIQDACDEKNHETESIFQSCYPKFTDSKPQHKHPSSKHQLASEP